MYYIIFLIAIIGLAEAFFEYWYICIPSTAVIMYYYLIKEKGKSKKKALNTTSICIVVLTIILLINKYPRDNESENDSDINIYNTEDSEDSNYLISENEESTETHEISSELQESCSDIEEYTNIHDEIGGSVENPFPHTEDYTVNNILIEYNKIAEYPIDEIIMNGMKNNTRPLGRVTITISNGVYFILLYNDYNKTIFVEYQEETEDNSGLYAVVRDMSKAIKPEMSDEEVETMMEDVKNGDKSGYYDNSLGVREFGFAVITREISKGKTQYLIKCKYTLHYN